MRDGGGELHQTFASSASGESQMVASSKYWTLTSDWTPRAASSTEKIKERGSNWVSPK